MLNNTEKIGYLGPKGTFSELAVYEFLKENQGYLPQAYATIPQVLQAVEAKKVNLGIVPVENSIEGTVTLTLDMLAHDVELYIQGEIILDIKHCLVSKCQEKDEISLIYSHPQALAQCRRFLTHHLPQAKCLTTNSTAEAALMVRNGDRGLAALSSHGAAQEYNLHVLYDSASDYADNQTRFLVIGREQKSLNKPNKTSLCLALAKNRPGGLYEILGAFVEDEEINLSKIESRPAKKELGEYLFFIDCQADIVNEKNNVLKKLQDMCKLVKVLGCYAQD